MRKWKTIHATGVAEIIAQIVWMGITDGQKSAGANGFCGLPRRGREKVARGWSEA
jgi:hypothetical protein